MPVIHRGRGGPVQNPPPSSRVEPEDVYQDVETGDWWLRLANRWTELPPDYLPSKAVTSNPGHGPLPDECHALLVSTWDGPPWRRTSLRCTRRGTHDWHGTRLEDGPGGGVQTLEWR